MDPRNYFTRNHKDLEGWIGYEISLDSYSQSLVGLLDLKKGDLVLDDGCGNGRFSVAIAKKGARVVALDINKSILRVATNLVKQEKSNNCLDPVQGDIQNLPFRESVFDKLLCAHNLWYIPNYQVAVSEMSRTLKTGGKVVADHLNILNWRILLVYSLYLMRKTLRKSPTPVFFRTPKEILRPFEAFITRIFSLSVSNEPIVDVRSKAWTPRLIISGSKKIGLRHASFFDQGTNLNGSHSAKKKANENSCLLRFESSSLRRNATPFIRSNMPRLLNVKLMHRSSRSQQRRFGRGSNEKN